MHAPQSGVCTPPYDAFLFSLFPSLLFLFFLGMQNLFIQLRKCCNHPALFCLGGAGGAFSGSSSSSFLPRTTTSSREDRSSSSSSCCSLYPAFLRSRMEEGEDKGTEETSMLYDSESLLRDSTKFQALKVVVDFYLQRQEKVVIFSYSTMMLDLVEDFLDEQGVYTARLDGRMNDEERRQALHAFLSTVKTRTSFPFSLSSLLPVLLSSFLFLALFISRPTQLHVEESRLRKHPFHRHSDGCTQRDVFVWMCLCVC